LPVKIIERALKSCEDRAAMKKGFDGELFQKGITVM
jgi:hypothetical protein